MTFLIAATFMSLASMPTETPAPTAEIVHEITPQYLYKIISFENWNASQGNQNVALSKDDEACIHFAKEDQLERIAAKYWSAAVAPEYIVLKVETARLVGKLVYETNPNGSNKYFHLYEGSIPVGAVADVQMIKN